MSTTTVTLTCPECCDPWDLHFPERFGGGCAGQDCSCSESRPVITAADRRAAVRATMGDTPLVSEIDDKRNVIVGHVVTQATPDESDYDPWVGVVVERWHTTDGEPGVTAVKFALRGGTVEVITKRWMVDELRQELLPSPDPWTCAHTARMLYRAIGQRIKRNGHSEPLNDTERRWALWANSLDHACT